MKRTTTFVILATVAAAIGGTAIADSHKGKDRGERGQRGDRAERMFERMDADENGQVTAEEVKAFAAKRFARRDVDGDGIVSREDRQNLRKQRREERRTERFEKIDADGDGTITKEEFVAFTPDRGERGKRRGMRGERGERHGMRGHHGHRQGKGKRRGEGRRMGRNAPLTIQEAEARALQRFERIDSDDKGYITLNDVKAFEADRRERRGKRGRH